MAADTTTDVRTRILEAALELLGEHGVGKLTQPGVAKAAGVRQSHLTYYFPTRADLLKATASHSIEALVNRLADRATEGRLTADALAKIASAEIGDMRRVRVVLGLIVASDEDPQIKPFLRDFVARARAGISRVVQLLGREADPDKVALFHTLVVGAAVLHMARNNAASRRESTAMVRYAVEQILPAESAAGGS